MRNNLITFAKHLFRRETILPPRSSFHRADQLLIALWAVILFTVFSGSIRKWVTGPGLAGNGIFLVQLLLPFFFYLLISKTNFKFQTPVMFSFFVIYLFVAAINPMNNTLFHGIFGIVIHLGFWTCWLAYYRARPLFEIEKFTNLWLVILIGEVILASIQYALPGTHFLNKFATGEDNNTVVGNTIRVAGTFSYLGGFQAWVVFNGFLVWFLIVRRYPPLIIMVVFTLSLFAGFVSGSRGSVGSLLIISVFGLMYTGFLAKNFFNIVLQFIVLAVFVFFLGEGVISKFDLAYTNFMTRVTSGTETGELEGRFFGSFDEVLNFRGEYPIYGIGLGSTYQGANILFGESIYAKEYGYYENELGRIVLEGGFILFFLRIILFIIMIRKSTIPRLGKIFVFVLFINTMTVFNFYQGIFFFLGLIFVDRAYYLEGRTK